MKHIPLLLINAVLSATCFTQSNGDYAKMVIKRYRRILLQIPLVKIQHFRS